MAWTYTVFHTLTGTRRRRWGTFENTSGTSGGDIKTGLGTIDSYSYDITTDPATFNQVTASVSGGTITITTDTNAAITGAWWAEGL